MPSAAARSFCWTPRLSSRSRTHSLTGASFEVASGLRRRRLAYAIIALAVLAALGSVVLHYVEPQFGAIGRVAELERANAALRDEVEKTRVAAITPMLPSPVSSRIRLLPRP